MPTPLKDAPHYGGPCRTCHYVCYPDGRPYCFRTDSRPTQSGCEFHRAPADRNEDGIRVLVVGPLTFDNQEAFNLALDKAWRRRAIEAVVHWGGPGVPALAARWCRKSGTAEVPIELDERPPVHEHPSFEYENRRVLKKGRPRAIIVFPGKSHRVEQLLDMVSVEMPIWRPFKG